MAPLKPTGFWSYTSKDDAASDGRLSQLRRLLANQLQQHGGRGEVHIFQDIQAIPPGTEWERQIDNALQQSSFCIPIITPGFLQSEWCNKEVLWFRKIMQDRGRDDLIVPIHYLDVDAFDMVRRGECFDPAVLAYLRRLQWIDFRRFRLRDPASEDVQRALDAVATGILSALYREVPSSPKAVVQPDPTGSAPAMKGGGLARSATATPDRPPPGNDVPSPGNRTWSGLAWKKPALWIALGIAVPAIIYLNTHFEPVQPALPPVASVPAKPEASPVVPAPPAAIPVAAALNEFRDTCPAEAICPAMVLIPHGSFQMGTTDQELVRENVFELLGTSEKPRHAVIIGADFYLGKYAVTVGEFRAFVRAKGARPPAWCETYEKDSYGRYTWSQRLDRSWEKPGFPQTDRDLAVCVSYDDALAYVDWLNSITRPGLYRLPSEAEWEYAARAGTVASRFWGDDRDPACGFANVSDRTLARRVNVASPNPEHYFDCDDGFAFTAPVGRFQPNGFGLYDMLGNVWQWTADCWNADYRTAPRDGSVRKTGSCDRRVLRGGAWFGYASEVRAGSREGYPAGIGFTDTGFRLARTI